MFKAGWRNTEIYFTSKWCYRVRPWPIQTWYLDYYSFRLITHANEVRRPRLYTISYIGSRASRWSVILGLGVTTRLRLGYYLRIIAYLSHGQHFPHNDGSCSTITWCSSCRRITILVSTSLMPYNRRISNLITTTHCRAIWVSTRFSKNYVSGIFGPTCDTLSLPTSTNVLSVNTSNP